MAKGRDNYITMYRHDYLFYAIDCEKCDAKICNLTPNHTSGEVLDRIEKHISKHHPEDA